MANPAPNSYFLMTNFPEERQVVSPPKSVPRNIIPSRDTPADQASIKKKRNNEVTSENRFPSGPPMNSLDMK